MEVTVRGKHFDVPAHVEERARQKFARLDHYLPAIEDASVEVDLTHEKAKEPDQRYLIHAILSGHGVHLQVQERAAQPEAAVDLAARVLSAQVRRYKQRLYERGRKRRTKPAGARSKPQKPGKLSSVARVKQFPVKPMTPEEAIEEMKLLGHEFFIFYHADLDQVTLVYRRQAGDYGLINPEIS